MLLEITHTNRFRYSQPVSGSHLEFRLTPLTDGSQHLLQHRRRVEPVQPVGEYVDYLGNQVVTFCVPHSHTSLEVVFESLVETFPTTYRGQPQVDAAHPSPAERLALYDFQHPTPLTDPGPEFLDWVRAYDFLRGASPRETARELRHAIHTNFRFEGDVTQASSAITDLLRLGAGVCQDFTHLLLTACRYFGHAARYVSGYVATDPDQAHIVASHAWVEVYDPEHGWFGVDPTHNEWVDDRHVRLGVGRDFREVAPNRGVFRGTAEEALEVVVLLRPLTSEELDERMHSRTSQPWTQRVRNAPRRRPLGPSILEQTLLWQQQQQQQ